MKFKLLVVGALLCAMLGKCDSKWCVKTKETQIVSYSPVDDSDSSQAGFVTESIPITKKILVCCEGYQLIGKDCVPICENGCPAEQKCVEPGVCGCGVGYHLKDNTCQLDCENNCENGVCDDDKCLCKEGYQKNFETNKCEPTCDLDCGPNAHCSAEGDCVCDSGFFRNELNVCQSLCKTPCKNGDCVDVNMCICHKGFVMVDGMCIPDCKSGCKFGDCLPNALCICWVGYMYNSTTRNCQEDNSSNNTSTTTANPLETLRQKRVGESCPEYCPNGECIDGTCRCGGGLVRADLLCAKHCQICQVGECVREELCKRLARIETESSLEMDPEEGAMTSSSSSPLETSTCPTGCWGGTCVNGVCQCTEGLVLTAENDCVRPCEKHCKMGSCTEDNICLCPEGYVLKDDTECVPVCDKSCENGFCIAPNRCECHEGYMHSLGTDQEHICKPTCDGLEGNEGCINGTCVGVNRCACLEGLIFNPNNRFECIPYPVGVAQGHRKRTWYIYLLIGILIVLLMIILLLLAIRKFHQDSYNVGKVEKHRGSACYHSV